MRTLNQRRAALLIRSLMRDLSVPDHVFVERVGEPTITASEVLKELEAQPTPADTGDCVASLAGKYINFTMKDMMALAANDKTGSLEAFCNDVQSMAASLNRQNERD